ncbi:MAG: PEP-CTERM sorting domain-containing protein [Crocosphaera sp.]
MKINAFLPVFGASVLSASVVTFASVANAATVVFDFTDGVGNNQTSFEKTVGTATATFFNPVTDSGTDTDDFNVNTLGLRLGTGFSNRSFDVTFDQDVELISYTTNFPSGTINFDIIGTGVSSLGNSSTDSDFVGQPLLLLAGETYSFTANTPAGFAGVSFATWTFDDLSVAESVPEPASIIGLLSIGALGLGLKGKKKG